MAKRILVVDDEAKLLRAVAVTLREEGYEVATALGLSVRTVEGHVSNILSKKGWGNRVEIARHVFKRDASG